jgi:hypothetical protein
MIKVKTTGQIPPFKNGTALPSPSQAPGSAFFADFSAIAINFLRMLFFPSQKGLLRVPKASFIFAKQAVSLVRSQ